MADPHPVEAGDGDEPIPLSPGDWEQPIGVMIGELATSADGGDVLEQGGAFGPGSFDWSGEVDQYDLYTGLVGSFETTVEDWGDDYGDVEVDVDVSVWGCLLELVW